MNNILKKLVLPLMGILSVFGVNATGLPTNQDFKELEKITSNTPLYLRPSVNIIGFTKNQKEAISLVGHFSHSSHASHHSHYSSR